ncbi:MAG TPA: histidine phosphatase family protein [Actinomycetes bacterium]
MKRRLVVLRHAKADWPAGVADHDRPLGRRGVRDSAAVGRWLVEHGDAPELVWCSTARRTRQTWEHLGGELPEGVDVHFEDDVYDAGVDDLLAVIRRTPKKTARVLLVGHNPGVQDLVLTLADRASGDARALAETKFPTSGLAVLDIDGEWADVHRGGANLSTFVVPRG